MMCVTILYPLNLLKYFMLKAITGHRDIQPRGPMYRTSAQMIDSALAVHPRLPKLAKTSPRES